jgi:hypothetical protein
MRPTSWRCAPLVAALLAACGGTTAQPAEGVDGSTDAHADGGQPGDDTGGPDAPADAPVDAPEYLTCMDASGHVDASLKACHGDSDCVIKPEQTDCCGTVLYVGIASASASRFDACEASWLAHFPACGCASAQTNTEDGKMSYSWMDASAPQVHCTNFTSAGGVCMTYTP